MSAALWALVQLIDAIDFTTSDCVTPTYGDWVGAFDLATMWDFTEVSQLVLLHSKLALFPIHSDRFETKPSKRCQAS